MAFMLFLIFISFLTALGVSALILPLIIRGKFVSLPRSFFATQLALALLARPLVDLATFIWYLLPVYGILSSLPTLAFSIFSSLLYSAAFVIFGNFFSKLVTAFLPIKNHLDFFSPFDIKENVKVSWDSLVTSVEDFLAGANFSETFQNVTIEQQEAPKFNPDDGFVKNFETVLNTHPMFLNFKFDQLRKNLTISDQTQQYLDTMNVAVIGFLENAQVEDVFNVTRLPSGFKASLQEATEALHLFAKEFNFTDLLKDGIFPTNAQDHFEKAGSALLVTITGADLKELYETTVLMPAKELNSNLTEGELLSMLRNPFQFVLTSGKNFNQAFPWKEIVSTFVASAWRHIVLVVFLLFVVIPLVFILRAALQDGCMWLVTRRYKIVIPSEQRSVSGWMFVAAISGLALAVTEAFPFCCVFFYIQFSITNLNPWLFVSLIFHALKAAPLRAASHMRLAEGVAETDILKERESGLRRGMIVGALFNGTFAMWWLFSSMAYLLDFITGFFWAVTMLTDIFLVGCSIGWGRRICRRMVAKEQRRKEEQDRKQD